MADLITLSCPSCGGKLEITEDIERFACAHCGNEHVVRRGRGIVSLAPVVAGLQKVQVGVDKTASELAMKRLQDEIANLQNQRHKAATDLSDQIKSIVASANGQVNAYERSQSVRQAAVRSWSIRLTITGGGILLLAVWLLLVGQQTQAAMLQCLVPAGLVCAAALGWQWLKLPPSDNEAGLRLDRTREAADEQALHVRTVGEEHLRVLDGKIADIQQQLERHRRIVSQ